VTARLNTEEFIRRARRLHGDTYGYSKVNYINNYTPVTIICEKHGSFEQKPNVHFRGSGCPSCSVEKQTMSTKDFIKKAQEVHGDEYDYSQVSYKNAKTSVTIICKKHGAFKQLADNHIRGMGCLECGREKTADKKTLTTEEFIEKAKRVHGNQYDYSQSKYEKGRTPLTIICKEHGPFEQTGTGHLAGRGCPECAQKTRADKKRSTTEEFIRKAKQIHGGKYNYSQVVYKLSNEPVVIICHRHGIFEQTPNNHLMGAGCPKCAIKKIPQCQPWTTKNFIKEAIKIHGDKYDYSQSNYKSARIPLTIICKEHGPFEQSPHSHLNETDCPKCAREKQAERQSTSFEVFEKRALAVHKGKYSYEKTKRTYSNLSTKAKFTCSIHGDFEQVPEHHLSGSGCPNCSESHGEKKIAIWLEENGIEFERQKTFDDLIGRNNRLLSYDFHLPEYHALIEFDGIQHFEPVKAWGKGKFEATQTYDRLKNAWAEKNGYCIQRIRYDEEDQIEKILQYLIERRLRPVN